MDAEQKTNFIDDILIDTIKIRDADISTNDGAATRHGEIVDIDGNHFEFHYVEEEDENSATEVEVILPDLAVTNNTIPEADEDQSISFHQEIAFEKEAQIGIDTDDVPAISQMQIISKVETTQQTPQYFITGGGLSCGDDQIFQLGDSGQFLRLATPDTSDPLRQHQFFLSDISSGEFVKLPDLPSAGTTSTVASTEIQSQKPQTTTLLKRTTSHRRRRRDESSSCHTIVSNKEILEIPVVRVDDEESDTSKNDEGSPYFVNKKEFQIQGPDIQIVSQDFLRPAYVNINERRNKFPSRTVNVPVPGGMAIEMQRYIFTKRLCRVCLLEKNDLISLYGKDAVVGTNGLIENSRGANASSRFNVISAIKTLLDVDVLHSDALPDQICMDCLDTLTAFSIFRKKISLGQAKLSEILDQVKHSEHPTIIPPLGEMDISRTGIFRQSEPIICAKRILSTSGYSHLVVRNLSDRIWDKIFTAMSLAVGIKSVKLKEVDFYCLESPYVTGWYCAQCNITIHGPRENYVQHFQLIGHQQSSKPEISYPCDLCGNSFPITDSTANSENYAEHWIQHFFFCECPTCGKRLPSVKGVCVHKRSAHADNSVLFKCPTLSCGKTFPKKTQLINHEKTHLNLEDRKVFMNFCSICSKYLTSSLSAHKSRVHSEDRPWKCEVCNKTFKRKEILVNHRDTVHLDSIKFQCEVCGAFLKSHSAKRVHILRHKGEKAHSCDICNKRFYTSSSLKSHSIRHMNITDIICTICKKPFKRKKYLVEHMRLHTGEKPFECPICGKEIRMKSNYFKHLGIHKKKDKAKFAEIEEAIT